MTVGELYEKVVENEKLGNYEKWCWTIMYLSSDYHTEIKEVLTSEVIAKCKLGGHYYKDVYEKALLYGAL